MATQISALKVWRIWGPAILALLLAACCTYCKLLTVATGYYEDASSAVDLTVAWLSCTYSPNQREVGRLLDWLAHTAPCASCASATFRKPAMLAPAGRHSQDGE